MILTVTQIISLNNIIKLIFKMVRRYVFFCGLDWIHKYYLQEIWLHKVNRASDRQLHNFSIRWLSDLYDDG
jgi:hypothetical protein